MTEDKEPFWVNCHSCSHEWVLFYTPIDVSTMAKFMKLPCPKCGEKKSIHIGIKPKPHNPAQDAGKTAEQRIHEWLASGDTGISSESLAFEYLGTERKRGICHPLDPADLGRCLRLIAIVPEVRKCVDNLAIKDDGWAKVAPIWDKISESMVDEVGIDWSKGDRAPNTYELMRKAGL